jgi:phosphonate transport system substrate-binding protein
MSDRSDGERERGSNGSGTMRRRRFIAAGSAGAVALAAGCTGGGGGGGSGDGSSGDGGATAGSADTEVEDIVMYLTPGTPSDVRRRYQPLVDMVNGEIDTVNAEAKVLGSYSAIRPALESEQGEIGMDDVTLISAPDLFDVYGTTVTGGSAFYFSMMVTNEDSDVEQRSDLEGGTMAFADRLSTSGSIFATYALREAGLDVGEAPQGQPVDFEGIWSNHEVALQNLANGEADAATTYGGNGLPHIPEDYRSDFPDRVLELSSALGTIDTEEPKFRPFWFSFPIPKQPVYARKSWESENKQKIGELMRSSDQELVSQYYPEDYNEEELPFTTLQNTSIDDYEPVITRLNELNIELG